jgi:diaminohydroxyphosphoribosylaminopyrimidine deaminase/5-amino-6-(5-phosphoribosylamino)uracil reductase
VAALGALTALSDGVRLQWREVQRVGDDLRLLARLPGRGDF